MLKSEVNCGKTVRVGTPIYLLAICVYECEFIFMKASPIYSMCKYYVASEHNCSYTNMLNCEFVNCMSVG